MGARRIRRNLAIVAVFALVFAGSGGLQAVDNVSPGGPEVFGRTDSRCPTFSWAAEGEADAIEIVVNRVGAMGIESKPIIQQTLPGRATTWTPSAEQCLERGGEYAWSARAISEAGSAEWSAPSFFRVTFGTSHAEFEQALEIVRGYLANRPQAAEAAAAPAGRTHSESISAGGGTPPSATTEPANTAFVVVDAGISLVDPSNNKYLYNQLDTVGTSGDTAASPPAADCNEANEYGRMFWDPSGWALGGRLWLCDDSGWRWTLITGSPI